MTDKARISEWKLERYLLGELPPFDMETIRKLAESDPDLRRRLEGLQRSNQDILKQYPAELMTRRILARAMPPAPTSPALGIRMRRFGSLPKLAAVAFAFLVVLLIFVPRRFDRTVRDSTLTEGGFKGGVPSLVLYRRIPSGAERLSEGSTTRPGDTIQIAYWGIGGHYGAILSLDGRGVVTLHFPENDSQSAPLAAGHLARLNSSYELDDAPGWECFYFVTSDKPFQVDSVLQAARKVGQVKSAPGRLPLSDAFAQSVFLLRKAVNP
jgi:hypothetical protein